MSLRNIIIDNNSVEMILLLKNKLQENNECLKKSEQIKFIYSNVINVTLKTTTGYNLYKVKFLKLEL